MIGNPYGEKPSKGPGKKPRKPDAVMLGFDWEKEYAAMSPEMQAKFAPVMEERRKIMAESERRKAEAKTEEMGAVADLRRGIGEREAMPPPKPPHAGKKVRLDLPAMTPERLAAYEAEKKKKQGFWSKLKGLFS